jgi:hypothetical protein
LNRYAACPLDGDHLMPDAAARHVQTKHSHLTGAEAFHLITWIREHGGAGGVIS